jgi:hypothetical protein
MKNLSLKTSKPNQWNEKSEIIFIDLTVGKWTTIHGVFSCEVNAKTISYKFNSGWTRLILSSLNSGLLNFSKLDDLIW